MKKQIFLDYNATTPLDKNALKYINSFANSPNNPSSTHLHGRNARKILNMCRNKLFEALEIDNKEYHICFVGSGTEANNLALHSFTNQIFCVSSIEHPSVFNFKKYFNNCIMLEVDKNGIISIDSYQKTLEKYKPKIVSIMYANNETGVIQNIKELAKIAHQHNCLFHCDAIQAIGKSYINFTELNCDMISISAHKIGGPTGCGALIYKKNITLKPINIGGGQENGLRSGTQNTLGIAGLYGALEKIKDRIAANQEISILRNYMENEILELAPSTHIFSINANRTPNTSCISMPNVENQLQLIKFDLHNISISAGSACSSGKTTDSPALSAMHTSKDIISNSIRVSLGPETTKAEINSFLEVWKDIYLSHNK